MQPEQFSRLTNAEKYYVVEQSGVCLELSYIDNGYQVALFALSAFYVAVWLNLKTDKLKRAEIIPYDELDRFLACIDLASIYTFL